MLPSSEEESGGGITGVLLLGGEGRLGGGFKHSGRSSTISPSSTSKRLLLNFCLALPCFPFLFKVRGISTLKAKHKNMAIILSNSHEALRIHRLVNRAFLK